MSLSAEIRERLLSSFRAELAEHIQTLNDGLLALEQGSVAEEQRQSVMETVFRAAHSLKGAARVVGATAIEQLAHALESVLDALQGDATAPAPEFFNACYRALDAIQATQAAYESGETTPPVQTLQALDALKPFHPSGSSRGQGGQSPSTDLTLTPKPGPAPKGSVGPAAEAVLSAALPSAEGVGHLTREGDETIRVSVSKLDALLAQLSELLVARIQAEQRLGQIRYLQMSLDLWQKEWIAVRDAYGRLSRERVDNVFRFAKPAGRAGQLDKDIACLLDYIENSRRQLRELGTYATRLSREYAGDIVHMARVIEEVEEKVKRINMLPLSVVTGPFGRMVRDLAQDAGKEIRLQIVGAEVELDKYVLEQIQDPLIHLLRNAVDHGIEPPERRVALSKARVGTITLEAVQSGREVIISVSDDGAGLSLEAIRRAVVSRSQVDAQSLSEAELVEAIFEAGVTTSSSVTDISGRGVGLNVVRRNLEVLQGRVDVDWTSGVGTTFKLTLPLRLTSVLGLLVRVSGESLVLPFSNVDRILVTSLDQIVPLEGQDTIHYGGRPLMLMRLGDVLELSSQTPRQNGSSIPIVILRAAEQRAAFIIDELVGECEIVVKGLGRHLARVGGIAGAAVLGSGEVALILNVADLIKLGSRGECHSILTRLGKAEESETERPPGRILIVDDSITTRTLEKNILSAAGYTVELATDGQEALSLITTRGVPDLIVSDIVMPRMDGFELTRRIKSDPSTASVPVILVTSLGSLGDKARGIQVGADAYIVKSAFDQDVLLETIQQLI